MRSEFTCKCSSSSDVSDVLLLSACLQLKYSIVQKRRIWAILRLWARIYCWGFSVEQFDEYMGSLIRKFEKQDGKPLSTAKLIRAVRLRSAGIRGNILELPFVVECLNRLRHAKHVFVSNRSRKSKQRQVKFEFGPSEAISRLRKKGILVSLSNPLVPMCPWLYEVPTTRRHQVAKHASEWQLRQHSKLSSDFYDPAVQLEAPRDELVSVLRAMGLHE